MRRPFLSSTLFALAVIGCRPTASTVSASPSADSLSIRRDIAWLADDAREGRGTGTAGNDSAARYIARRYEALGLIPLGDSTAQGVERYLQHFVAKPAAAGHTGLPAELPSQNVIAMLPGRDPSLRGEYVILGAHYDHLGRATFGALDPASGAVIRNGADDNASGTAAVLELARLLARRPTRRSVIFANFSGEELGLLGSQYMVAHFPVAIDRVSSMLNFDMVGRLRDEKLIVYGVATAQGLAALVDSANVAPALKIAAQGDGFGPSDQSSFYARGVPVLHFFTDLHSDYHTATDDIERIDAGGEARVVALAERVARTIADRNARLTPVRLPPAPMTTSSRQGSDVYLGSIPDMSAGDVAGLRITGVRAGSPAEQAGLKAGDVVVELAGAKVTDLNTYSDALYSHQPGDRITIVVVRDGQRVTLTTVLGKRGG